MFTSLFSNNKKELETLKENNLNFKNEITTLKLAISDYINNINKLNTNLSSLQAKNIELQTYINTLQSKNTFLENEISSKEITITTLNNTNTYLNKLLEPAFDLQSKIGALDKSIKEKESILANQANIIEKNNNKITIYQKHLKKYKEEIIELRDEILLQSFSLYRPTYSFANSEEYKNKLEEIREEQKSLIRFDLATTCKTNWTVNNSYRKGEKMVKDTKKLLLSAFNSECEYIVSKVKFNNFDTCLKRMLRSAKNISKLGISSCDINIEQEYIDLKIQELKLALEYQLKKQEEKELAREAKARAREEAKVLKELQEERAKAEKEKSHYTNAINETKKLLENSTDQKQHIALIEKLKELQERMDEINTNIANIDYREANQRAGYVYIISNIGSFGENIYKIGMTRRLDPMERIYELGNASVPFNFDVHAMIFSDDAPKLEAALHKAFEDKKINMINKRREFFKVTLEEIEKVVKENFDGSVEFIKNPDAQQYRETLKIKELYFNTKDN